MADMRSVPELFGPMNPVPSHPIEAFSRSSEGLRLLKDVLSSRGFELADVNEDPMPPEGILTVCNAIGTNYYRINEFLNCLTVDFAQNCRAGVCYRFDPIGTSAPAIKYVFSMLEKYGFINEAFLDVKGLLTLRQPDLPAIRRIITGMWLEHHLYAAFLNHDGFACTGLGLYRNVIVKDPTGSYHEIDAVAVRDGRIAIVEARTGDFRSVLPKYCALAGQLGLPTQQIIVVAPRAEAAQSEAIGFLYGVRVLNLWGGLRARLFEALKDTLCLEEKPREDKTENAA